MRVLTFLYLWYSTPSGSSGGGYSHWNHTVLPHWTEAVNNRYEGMIGTSYSPEDGNLHSPYYPAGGPYSSDDPAKLKSQMLELQSAGVDVAVASWWGRPGVSSADSQGTQTDHIFPALLHACKGTSVKVAFLLEPYHNRNSSNIVDDVNYIMDRYSSDSSVYTLSDRVVFYVYDSYHIPYDEWRTAVMPKIGAMGYYYGLVLDPSDVTQLIEAKFDGGFTYFASERMSWASDSRNWPEMCDKLKTGGLDCDISVGFGYNDTKIRPWNSQNTVPRSSQYFRRQIDRVLGASPTSISITSFNEWGEGTQWERCESREGYSECQAFEAEMIANINTRIDDEF
ncbi:hypothetical protein TrVE_jg12387 [Triparma verrucosa]|uniref:Uncharacterized protein n=1 Tax=Triparma verrucosa TaxID=1606542 RepID=A0A9W7FBF3_9STRA|nr:hypothetical protein TrVE_jg12387 [Triparma verrucosa]